MQAVILFDGNPATVLAGVGSNLYTVNLSEDILVPVFGIQERNFAFVTLEIKIVGHLQNLPLVKKKIV